MTEQVVQILLSIALAVVSGLTKLPPDRLQMFVEAAVARLKAAKEELTKKGDAVVLKTA